MLEDFRPIVYIIAGPNGAGKTTCAFSIMPELLDCYEYANADAIAAGLSPFKPLEVSMEAGRLMLKRIRDLAESGVTFAIETTLASKSLAPFLARCKRRGYSIRLIFIWVNSVELAVERVKRRVESGGISFRKRQ
jgi:predicted ABC-type ATPase